MRLLLILALTCGHLREARASTDALNTAARALYYQQHWDEDVNRYLASYERDFTLEQKRAAVLAYHVAKFLIEQQVTFRWSW